MSKLQEIAILSFLVLLEFFLGKLKWQGWDTDIITLPPGFPGRLVTQDIQSRVQFLNDVVFQTDCPVKLLNIGIFFSHSLIQVNQKYFRDFTWLILIHKMSQHMIDICLKNRATIQTAFLLFSYHDSSLCRGQIKDWGRICQSQAGSLCTMLILWQV